MKRRGSVLVEVLVSCFIFFLGVATVSSGVSISTLEREKEFRLLHCRNISYQIHACYVNDSSNWLSTYLEEEGVKEGDVKDQTIYYDASFVLSLAEEKYEMIYQEEENSLTLSFYVTQTGKEILGDVSIGGEP